MADYDRIILVGSLVRDSDLRCVHSGSPDEIHDRGQAQNEAGTTTSTTSTRRPGQSGRHEQHVSPNATPVFVEGRLANRPHGRQHCLASS